MLMDSVFDQYQNISQKIIKQFIIVVNIFMIHCSVKWMLNNFAIVCEFPNVMIPMMTINCLCLRDIKL